MEHKIFQAEVKEANEADLTVTHFISTQHRDRGGDILYAGKNERGKGMVVNGRPVCLLLHGFNPSLGSEPVAKPVWIKQGEFKGKPGVEVKTQFYPDETGRRLWGKTSQGFMPNWSVGWDPIIHEVKTEKNGEQTRHCYEWELYEYSPVGVSMNPFAQKPSDKNKAEMTFKIMPEESGDEEIDEKDLEDVIEEKPYPNEHACRINDPDKYKRIRRQNDKFGEGIHAIWGVTDADKTELQAIRFSKDKFTAAEAKKWCGDHDYTCRPFEEASEKEEKDVATDESVLSEELSIPPEDNPEKEKERIEPDNKLIPDELLEQIKGLTKDIAILNGTINELKDFMKELKENSEKESTPVLVLSAQPGAETKDGDGDNDNPPEMASIIVEEVKPETIIVADPADIAKMAQEVAHEAINAEIRKMQGKVD